MPKIKFMFDKEVFEMEDTVDEHGLPRKAMEAANDHFKDLPQGAWFGPRDGSPENTWIWYRGNFFD